MTTAAIQEVRPDGGRYEALVLAVATACVIGVLAVYVHERGGSNGREPLHEWQVSAFDVLTGADQAIYNSLYTVKDEIPFIYDDINLANPPGVKFHWPDLQDFENLLLPPFHRDTSWQQTGSLQWSLYEPLAEGEMQGSTMYLGTDGRLPGQGSFLLVIGHVHAGITNNNAIVVWWNAKNHVDMPQSGFRDGLILHGWKEVIPYDGAQEVKRIFGDDSDKEAVDDEEKQAERVIKGIFGE